MTKRKQELADAEKFVKDVLQKNFKQKLNAASLRVAAEKVLDAVPNPAPTPNKRAA